jgi:hypothetical protein
METSDNNTTDETTFTHNSVKNITIKPTVPYLRHTQCGGCHEFHRDEYIEFTPVLHIPYCSQYCKEMVV